MADLTELEQRLKAALARISAGLEQVVLSNTASSTEQTAHVAHLQAQLDLERQARSQGEASLPNAQDADAAAQIAHLQRSLDEAAFENQGLHSAIAGLRQDLRLMDEEAEAHLAQAHRATEALQAEFDAMTQAREAETAEIAKILAALAPLIDAEEGHPHAGT